MTNQDIRTQDNWHALWLSIVKNKSSEESLSDMHLLPYVPYKKDKDDE